MQMEEINNVLGAVEENSNEIPTLGNGLETSLQSSEVQEIDEPKDVNQYLEYMRQKREALERAATVETVTEPEAVTESVVEEKKEEIKEGKKSKEGEKMKKRDEMELEPASEGSIEDMVAKAMQKDDILLYQKKYLDSLEARKSKVETIISMLEKEKETIDAQIQAVK